MRGEEIVLWKSLYRSTGSDFLPSSPGLHHWAAWWARAQRVWPARRHLGSWSDGWWRTWASGRAPPAAGRLSSGQGPSEWTGWSCLLPTSLGTWQPAPADLWLDCTGCLRVRRSETTIIKQTMCNFDKRCNTYAYTCLHIDPCFKTYQAHWWQWWSWCSAWWCCILRRLWLCWLRTGCPSRCHTLCPATLPPSPCHRDHPLPRQRQELWDVRNIGLNHYSTVISLTGVIQIQWWLSIYFGGNITLLILIQIFSPIFYRKTTSKPNKGGQGSDLSINASIQKLEVGTVMKKIFNRLSSKSWRKRGSQQKWTKN